MHNPQYTHVKNPYNPNTVRPIALLQRSNLQTVHAHTRGHTEANAHYERTHTSLPQAIQFGGTYRNMPIAEPRYELEALSELQRH